MFWNDNTFGKALVTYMMLTMFVGIAGRLIPEFGHMYMAIHYLVGLFMMSRLFRRY